MLPRRCLWTSGVDAGSSAAEGADAFRPGFTTSTQSAGSATWCPMYFEGLETAIPVDPSIQYEKQEPLPYGELIQKTGLPRSVAESHKEFTTDNAQINIFSMTGELVHSEKFHSQINLGKLKSGIYLVKIESENDSITRKIIKE